MSDHQVCTEATANWWSNRFTLQYGLLSTTKESYRYHMVRVDGRRVSMEKVTGCDSEQTGGDPSAGLRDNRPQITH